MLKYQVTHCNQIGFRLLLFLVLAMVTWQALSPQPAEATRLINDKLGHCLVFLILAIISDHAYATTHFNLRKASLLLAYGIAIECLQYYVPGREFSFLDMLADAAGLLLYFIVVNTLISRTPTPVKQFNNNLFN
jgi:VanZ family protein